MYSNQGNQQISGKELLYVADTLKNEELLAKLCVQGAVNSQSQSLKQTLSHLSQERLQNISVLINTLQQQSGITH
ncbi:hypothetical protein M5X11_11795 [Paenibacillus alginolyticus]|jgi:hypothetical protein|uniref:Spore coat protein n=1 Tax=Paenibacillus alginolyticus TaxID=59839 RepID=A0ABT4GH27_9BACL|nr:MULTISPECIES: hypothetical protein [Paenibacillus]MCY9665638.1 hypothetical protein [Paenibacillus alginolyticus]MCY9695485.1 hypothetical protein [Paenibacillus alginolyticus]MEC0148211.1 hypothetical protein [Paenibacillus alginolyticus]NRF93721.1 hypothetical protein [Paenibacillus frigoriresistens]